MVFKVKKIQKKKSGNDCFNDSNNKNTNDLLCERKQLVNQIKLVLLHGTISKMLTY